MAEYGGNTATKKCEQSNRDFASKLKLKQKKNRQGCYLAGLLLRRGGTGAPRRDLLYFLQYTILKTGIRKGVGGPKLQNPISPFDVMSSSPPAMKLIPAKPSAFAVPLISPAAITFPP